MTQSEIGDGDYPDGSVGRYVRERWGVATPPRRAAAPPEPVEERLAAARAQDDVEAELDAELELDAHDAPTPAAGWPSHRSSAGHGTRTDPLSAVPRSAADPVPGAGPVADRAAVAETGPMPARPAVEGWPPAVDAGDRAPATDAAGAPLRIADAIIPPVTERAAAASAGGAGHEGPPSQRTASPAEERPGRRVPAAFAGRTAGRPGADPSPLFEETTAPPVTTEVTAPAPVVAPAPAPPRETAHETSRETARWTDPDAVAAQEAQRARSAEHEAQHARAAEPAERRDLSSARLLRPVRRPPRSGWRRLVYVLSGRLVNPGESPVDVRRRELTARVNQPLLGCYKIAMLSLKGGVGKTTVTATLGSTFASLRGDRVVAVDANPDRGTLSQKIPLETSATVRNLLQDAQRVRRYTDVRAYTSQGPSRLEVLASEQDPAVSEAFSEDDYRRTVTLLEHFYNIVLTDCGTGLMHSAMYGVLGVADQLIIVSSSSLDGARSASATMDWLDAHGHEDLVRNSVAVVNNVSRSAGGVDLDRVAEHFAARCRAVVRIPFDAHLQEGAEVDLDRLEPATRDALLELAAHVADAFDGAVPR